MPDLTFEQLKQSANYDPEEYLKLRIRQLGADPANVDYRDLGDGEVAVYSQGEPLALVTERGVESISPRTWGQYLSPVRIAEDIGETVVAAATPPGVAAARGRPAPGLLLPLFSGVEETEEAVVGGVEALTGISPEGFADVSGISLPQTVRRYRHRESENLAQGLAWFSGRVGPAVPLDILLTKGLATSGTLASKTLMLASQMRNYTRMRRAIVPFRRAAQELAYPGTYRGAFARGVLAGAGTDFFIENPAEGNLADALVAFGFDPAGVVSAFETDPNSSDFVNRLRGSVIGGALGGLSETVLRWVQGSYRTLKQAEPEAIKEAKAKGIELEETDAWKQAEAIVYGGGPEGAARVADELAESAENSAKGLTVEETGATVRMADDGTVETIVDAADTPRDRAAMRLQRMSDDYGIDMDPDLLERLRQYKTWTKNEFYRLTDKARARITSKVELREFLKLIDQYIPGVAVQKDGEVLDIVARNGGDPEAARDLLRTMGDNKDVIAPSVMIHDQYMNRVAEDMIAGLRGDVAGDAEAFVRFASAYDELVMGRQEMQDAAVFGGRFLRSLDTPMDEVSAALKKDLETLDAIDTALQSGKHTPDEQKVLRSARKAKKMDLEKKVQKHGRNRSEAARFKRLMEKTGETDLLKLREMAVKWYDRLLNLRINGLLSSPPTHIVNNVTSMIKAVSDPGTRALGAAMRGSLGEAYQNMRLSMAIAGELWSIGSRSVAKGATLQFKDMPTLMTNFSQEMRNYLAGTRFEQGRADQAILGGTRFGRGPVGRGIERFLQLPGRAMEHSDRMIKIAVLRAHVKVQTMEDMGYFSKGFVATPETDAALQRSVELNVKEALVNPTAYGRGEANSYAKAQKRVYEKYDIEEIEDLDVRAQRAHTVAEDRWDEYRRGQTEESLERARASQAAAEAADRRRMEVEEEIFDESGLEWLKDVREGALAATFQTELTGWKKKWQDALQSLWLGRMVFPFVRTPLNILSETINYTPVLGGLWRAAREGGFSDELLGKQTVGMMGLGMVTSLYSSDRITGASPKDPNERRRWREAGKQPYSIRVPGIGWLQYNRFDPFGGALGFMADGFQLGTKVQRGDFEDEGDISTEEKLANAGFDVLWGTIQDKSFLQGLHSLMRLTEANEDAVRRYLEREAVTFLPYSSMVRRLEAVADPVVEDTRVPYAQIYTYLEGLGTLAGGVDLEETHPILRIDGQEVTKGGWVEVFNPFTWSPDLLDDPVYGFLAATQGSVNTSVPRQIGPVKLSRKDQAIISGMSRTIRIDVGGEKLSLYDYMDQAIPLVLERQPDLFDQPAHVQREFIPIQQMNTNIRKFINEAARRYVMSSPETRKRFADQHTVRYYRRTQGRNPTEAEREEGVTSILEELTQ